MKMKEKRTMDFNSTKENSYSTTVDSRLHFGLSRENAELLHTASIYTLCAFIFFPTRSLSTNHKLKWMSHPWTEINFSAFFCMNYGIFRLQNNANHSLLLISMEYSNIYWNHFEIKRTLIFWLFSYFLLFFLNQNQTFPHWNFPFNTQQLYLLTKTLNKNISKTNWLVF